jgi:hypothetical protein
MTKNSYIRRGFPRQKEKQAYLIHTQAGLPDGIFPNEKSQFGKILEGFGMEKAGIYTYYMAIWNFNFRVLWYI